jgi:hypothetical protein
MSSEETAKDQETSAETPELSEEGKEEVRRMREAYDDDRPTAVMPGTDKTITGVAVNEWLDDEGNPKFGKDKQEQDQNDTENDQNDTENDQNHTENDQSDTENA